MIIKSFSLFFLLMFLMIGCGVSNTNLVEEYNDFGVKCAKIGLWDEAIMRWKHVIGMDPNNAKAHNNLGVAYESKGEMEAAMAEYKKAIELEPGNKVYANNYNRFKRNYDKLLDKSLSKGYQGRPPLERVKDEDSEDFRL